jgi:hypothetical protein
MMAMSFDGTQRKSKAAAGECPAPGASARQLTALPVILFSAAQQIPHDNDHHDQQHGKDGAAADAVHSRTSYSNETPSGSFSCSHVWAAALLTKTLRCSGSPTSLLC